MPHLIAPPGGRIPAGFLTSLTFVKFFMQNTIPFHTPPSPHSEVDTISDTLSATGDASPHARAAPLGELIPEHELNDNDADAPLAPHAISALTAASTDSASATTCVVCMDSDKDIALAPCKHSHCCLACFRRSQMHSCPICRTPVTSILILSTGVQLPVAIVAPKALRDRHVQTRSTGNLHDTVLHEMPRNFHSRRSLPSLMSGLDDDAFSIRSRTTSMSSVNVATQAQSSVRSLPREQDVAFRQLRETGFVQPQLFAPARADSSLQRRNTFASTTSPAVATVSEANNQAGAAATTQNATNETRQNMVLIGHNRTVLMSLAQRILATFPPVDGQDIAARSKSTVYINGEAIRLVLIECPMFSMGPELVLRVQRQSPKLVLLCADYFNVSSFESIVRLDMEMLDYLNITCVWVLVKSTWRPTESNIVEEADVRTAKHFLSKPRKCFIAPVDGGLQGVAMRKLGLYIYKAVSRDASSRRPPRTLGGKHSGVPLRSLSFFCLRPDKRSRRQRSASKSTTNLARWLW